MLRQSRESINVISMFMSQMNMADRGNHHIKLSMCYKHSNHKKKLKEKVSINQLIKCHISINSSSSLTFYSSLVESSFCGPRIFLDAFLLDGETGSFIYLVKI